MGKIKNKYIGDKAFYTTVLAIAVPIMIQNGFTNFVSLLDNLMVGRIGTEEMSGVSISNQLLFVFNLCIFGIVSGAGIYGAQYFGKKDDEGIRITIRFKIIFSTIITLFSILLFIFQGENLISLFLQGSNDGGDLEATLYYGRKYLRVMLFGLPGFAITQVYASTLREGGETVLPMKAGIFAILTNLVFNYLLIYGKLGFPRLGVEGAAIATVLSRYVECSIIIVISHKRKDKYSYLSSLYSTLLIPKRMLIDITKAALPMILNETLWSLGMTFMSQCYSTRGLNAVAGSNISSTINNLFNVTFMSVGSAISIIIGQMLGAGKTEEAVDTDRKLITFSVLVGAATGIVMALVAPYFPNLYNTTEGAKLVATELILAQACCLPIFGFKNASYFTIRSGGRVWITIIFDSAFMWAVSVPIAYLVSRYTSLSVLWIFLTVEAGDLIKCAIGYYLVKKQIWVRNIVK